MVWNNMKNIFLLLYKFKWCKTDFSKYCFIFYSISENCQINYCPSFLRLYLSLSSCTYIILCRGNFITETWNNWDILEYKYSRSVLNNLQVLIHSRETHLILTISAQPKASTRNSETWALLVFTLTSSGSLLSSIIQFQKKSDSVAPLWLEYKKLLSFSCLLSYFMEGLLGSCFL